VQRREEHAAEGRLSQPSLLSRRPYSKVQHAGAPYLLRRVLRRRLRARHLLPRRLQCALQPAAVALKPCRELGLRLAQLVLQLVRGRGARRLGRAAARLQRAPGQGEARQLPFQAYGLCCVYLAYATASRPDFNPTATIHQVPPPGARQLLVGIPPLPLQPLAQRLQVPQDRLQV
jgi:hypothetical protein